MSVKPLTYFIEPIWWLLSSIHVDVQLVVLLEYECIRPMRPGMSCYIATLLGLAQLWNQKTIMVSD